MNVKMNAVDLHAAEDKIAANSETPVKTQFLGKIMQPEKTVFLLSFFLKDPVFSSVLLKNLALQTWR